MYQSTQQLPALLEALKPILRIAVIYSGDASLPKASLFQTFNERHWKSYQAVAQNIKDTLHEEGFTQVVLLPDDASLATRLQEENIHLAWLNTAGMQGRNAIGHTAGLLESLGVAYIGHSPLNNALMDHKLAFKRQLLCLGLETPPWLTWHPDDVPDKVAFAKYFHQSFPKSGGPWIVKPVCSRASRYLYMADNFSDIWDKACHVYDKTLNQVLIESYMPGSEYCVSMGPPLRRINGTYTVSDAPTAFSFVERLLGEDEPIFQSIDTMPLHHHRARLLDPVGEAPIIKGLTDIGTRIYRDLKLNYLIRIDVRTSKNGVLHILEANPKPDLKRPNNGISSLVSLGLAEMGMTYADLMMSLLAGYLDGNLRFRPRALASLEAPLSQLDGTGRPWMNPLAQSM